MTLALVRLEGQQVDEGRLGSLDLRREHGLLADEGVEEPVERRDHLSGELEPDERLLGRADAPGERRLNDDGRLRGGQRVRDEGRDLFSPEGGSLVPACGSPGHGKADVTEGRR